MPNRGRPYYSTLVLDSVGQGLLYVDAAGVEQSSVRWYSGNPNGFVQAEIGALCLSPIGLWENIDGVTAWNNLSSGGGSGGNTFRTPFTFASGTLFLFALVPGDLVRNAEVVITIPFDDLAATVTVGTPGSPGVLLDVADTDPPSVGRYGPDNDYQPLIAENLEVVVTPAASTQGTGYVLFTLGI